MSHLDFFKLQVIDELKSYDTITHDRSSDCCDFMPMGMPMGMAGGRRKRMVWWGYPRYFGGSDAQSIFDVWQILVFSLMYVIHC